jgi:hypothetical protein
MWSLSRHGFIQRNPLRTSQFQLMNLIEFVNYARKHISWITFFSGIIHKNIWGKAVKLLPPIEGQKFFKMLLFTQGSPNFFRQTTILYCLFMTASLGDFSCTNNYGKTNQKLCISKLLHLGFQSQHCPIFIFSTLLLQFLKISLSKILLKISLFIIPNIKAPEAIFHVGVFFKN